MRPKNEIPDGAYEYHPFAIAYATIDRQSPSIAQDLPAVFNTGSPGWTATLIDILVWDPDEIIAYNEVGLPGVKDEDIDKVFATSLPSTPSPAASSPTPGHFTSEETEENTDKEQEADSRTLRVRVERSIDGDADSTFKCPIMNCKKEYAHRDNIYRHAQKAHSSHVFTCHASVWTITPKHEKHDTPNKQQTKRKTPHKDEPRLHTPSVKRQKQANPHTVSDRGNNVSPMMFETLMTSSKTSDSGLVDMIADAVEAEQEIPTSDPVNPVSLHGISKAAEDHEIDGQHRARLANPGVLRSALSRQGGSFSAADIERRLSSPPTSNDISSCDRTDRAIISCSSAPLKTPTESTEVKCETAGDLNGSPRHSSADMVRPYSLVDSPAILMAPGFPQHSLRERDCGPMYRGFDASKQDASAFGSGEEAVTGDSAADFPKPEGAPENTAGEACGRTFPSDVTENLVAAKERRPRATADRVIASNGFENAEGLVKGGSSRISQKKNSEKSKASVVTKPRRSRAKK